jgi:hypothetical protein
MFMAAVSELAAITDMDTVAPAIMAATVTAADGIAVGEVAAGSTKRLGRGFRAPLFLNCAQLDTLFEMNSKVDRLG